MDELEISDELFFFYLLYLSDASLRNPGTSQSVSIAWPALASLPQAVTHPAPPRLIWVQTNEMLDRLFSWGAWSKRSKVTRSNRSSRVESAWGGAGERGSVKALYTRRSISCLLPAPSGTPGIRACCRDVQFSDHATNKFQTSRTNRHWKVSSV